MGTETEDYDSNVRGEQTKWGKRPEMNEEWQDSFASKCLTLLTLTHNGEERLIHYYGSKLWRNALFITNGVANIYATNAVASSKFKYKQKFEMGEQWGDLKLF